MGNYLISYIFVFRCNKQILCLKKIEYDCFNLSCIVFSYCSLMGDHNEEMEKLRSEKDRFKKEISDGQRERQMMQEEIEAQKEANARAPTATMKKLVERLRGELAMKEKQQQVRSYVCLFIVSNVRHTGHRSYSHD